MKLYLSVDMEGLTDVTSWDEVNKNNSDYRIFSEIMTNEVVAACEGANIFDENIEIFVKDGHGTGRNIIHGKLPHNVVLIRGWSGHPFHMMDYLDESFDAVLFIGYHSAAKSNTNALSHTLNNRKVYSITINDESASEFLINSYTSMLKGVPVVFISGDEGICNTAKLFNKNIRTVITKNCISGSTINNHPKINCAKIKNEVSEVLKENISSFKINLPKKFNVKIEFKEHQNAFRSSFYPGIKLISDNLIQYETNNYFDVLTMLIFVLPD